MPPYRRAMGAAVTRMATYAAISTVAAREMRLASRLARRLRSLRQSGQSSPQPSPRTRRSHLTQGTSGSPLGNGTTELLGAGGSAQVAGADTVADDRSEDGVSEPLSAIQLAEVIEHHRRRQHLGRRVGETLPGNVGRAAMHGFEDRGFSADVGPGREP